MKPQRHTKFFLLGMAICDTMRHTGTSVVTSDISAQMNGHKIELVPNPLKEIEKWEAQNTVSIIFNKGSDPFNSLMSLKKRSSGQRRFTGTTSNTAPLRHYKNPRRPRRG
ncbi:MAG: hypothetical protein WCJ74_01680 [bacterium]